jgi:hypothetical protein
MSHKFVIFAVMVWMIGAILGASFDKTDISTYAMGTDGTTHTSVTTQSTLNYLMNFQSMGYTGGTTGVWSMVKSGPSFLPTLFNVLTFNFGFMQGPGFQILRLVIFLPIGIGVFFGIWEILVNLLQGLVSALIP